MHKTDTVSSFRTSAKPMWQTSLILLATALLCLPFFDMEIAHTDPWFEMSLMAQGLLSPDFSIHGLGAATLQTLAFALQAVCFSALLGFVFAQLYHLPGLRYLMTFLRSIHELFWALILLQIFGFCSLTGVLAIAIPYSATFARVFAEILQETPKYSYKQLSGGRFSRFVFSTLPLAWPRMITYSRYRLECALRASVVLGFIGLPTLGFMLEGALKIGRYGEVVTLLLVFIILVLSINRWAKGPVLAVLFILSLILFPPVLFPDTPLQAQLLKQLLHDLVPEPLLVSGGSEMLGAWFLSLWQTQILPGVAYTLILGQLALFVAAFLALLWFPLICKHILEEQWLRNVNHFFLVVLRCLPEYLLAFIALILFGPSMLPGVLAIGLHNAALLAHLMGAYSNELRLRSDCAGGPDLYVYELLPRIYPQFLSFTLYRGETIFRETAILGVLGIPTLGFYIDSAFEEFHFDRALLLILASVLINIGAEIFATKLRQYLHVNNSDLAH